MRGSQSTRGSLRQCRGKPLLTYTAPPGPTFTPTIWKASCRPSSAHTSPLLPSPHLETKQQDGVPESPLLTVQWGLMGGLSLRARSLGSRSHPTQRHPTALPTAAGSCFVPVVSPEPGPVSGTLDRDNQHGDADSPPSSPRPQKGTVLGCPHLPSGGHRTLFTVGPGGANSQER